MASHERSLTPKEIMAATCLRRYVGVLPLPSPSARPSAAPSASIPPCLQPAMLPLLLPVAPRWTELAHTRNPTTLQCPSTQPVTRLPPPRAPRPRAWPPSTPPGPRLELALAAWTMCLWQQHPPSSCPCKPSPRYKPPAVKEEAPLRPPRGGPHHPSPSPLQEHPPTAPCLPGVQRVPRPPWTRGSPGLSRASHRIHRHGCPQERQHRPSRRCSRPGGAWTSGLQE